MMTVNAGKGRIELDDIAKGVTYREVPIHRHDNFAVLTPDVPSQKRFFKIENYSHKYLEKEKRSPFVEYRQKIIPREGYDYSTLSPKRAETPAEIVPQAEQALSEAPADNPNIISQERTQPQDIPPMQAPTMLRPQSSGFLMRKSKVPVKRDIYHPKELYLLGNQTTRDQGEPFHSKNPFQGSKFHNMFSTLRLGMRATLQDVIDKAQEERKCLRTSLMQQRDPQFLRTQQLPKLPRVRSELLIANSSVLKNVAKRAGNDAHGKVTNGGYSRTSYGGFYMHQPPTNQIVNCEN